MSLNKAIENKKEHRKPYTGCKAIDATCRNHGGCSWCEANRCRKFIVREQASAARLKEFHFEEVWEEN